MANFKNKKLLMTLVAGLGGIGLIGTGFASWVISQSDQGESTGGIVADADVRRSEVQIGDATVQYFYSNDGVATDMVASNARVMFGPNVAYVENGWLEAKLNKTEGDNFYKEALTVKITFPFMYKYANSETPDKVTLSVAPHGHYEGASNGTEIFYYAKATSKTNYEKALDANLVAAFPTFATGVDATFYENEDCTTAAKSAFVETPKTQITVDKSELNKQLYLQFVVTFDWGTAFGGYNPMTFYNGEGKSLATYGDEATTNLGKLSDLTDCSYRLGFSVTA